VEVLRSVLSIQMPADAEGSSGLRALRSLEFGNSNKFSPSAMLTGAHEIVQLSDAPSYIQRLTFCGLLLYLAKQNLF
jgi:hypothetical protein